MLKYAHRHLSFQQTIIALLMEGPASVLMALTVWVIVAEGWGGCGSFLKEQ